MARREPKYGQILDKRPASAKSSISFGVAWIDYKMIWFLPQDAYIPRSDRENQAFSPRRLSGVDTDTSSHPILLKH
jgi:hypothetical protein